MTASVSASTALHTTAPVAPAFAHLSAEPATAGLKDEIIAALWRTVDGLGYVQSATLTGSFLIGDGLGGISDIDFVVVVDQLDEARFAELQAACREALQPVVCAANYVLRINPTLGPLKFNDDRTAVLHLMLYSRAAHIDHVIKSPFTCFDWQRSQTFRKQPMAGVYPVFALQPHHFVSARRSVQEYLKDYRAGIVSYRELVCNDTGYREERRVKPMHPRDRHEFAYHILRFLMQNLLKLVHRRNEAPDGEVLLNEFLTVFPLDADDTRKLYRELVAKKKSLDFAWPLPDLDRRLENFVGNFEAQFRRVFFSEGTRHVLFRHAATALNGQPGEGQRFLGRSNPEIGAVDEAALDALGAALPAGDIEAAFVSPLLRCQQTYDLLAARRKLPVPTIDNRLIEIDYGGCEGQSVSAARKVHPTLFAAWQRGEDPAFPGGEATADVARRAQAFIDDRWSAADGSTVTCTHNVVLRAIVGQALQVPRVWWHRLRIPHVAPLLFVQTRRFGWFADLDENVERAVFEDFGKVS